MYEYVLPHGVINDDDDRPLSLSYASLAVSFSLSRTADFRLTSLRPCLWRTHQPSLSACFWTHQVQDAVLVYKVLHGCALSYLGQFTYVADLPSRRGLRSSCSDCLVQPPVHRSTVGIFCCWPSGVELPATGGYVSTVSGDLPHSTQDVSVYWVISWHSTHLKFCIYTLSIVDLVVFLILRPL